MSGNTIKYTYENLRNILNQNDFELVQFENKQHIIRSFKQSTGKKIHHDDNGYYIIQNDGSHRYIRERQKYGLMPTWCPQCGRIMGKSQLDEKFWNIHKRCFQCSISLQHQMKLDGVWQAYETSYILNMMLEDCREAIQFYKEIKSQSNRQVVINQQGEIQKWGIDDIQQFNSMMDKIIDQLMEFKQSIIKRLSQETNKLNAKKENIEQGVD